MPRYSLPYSTPRRLKVSMSISPGGDQATYFPNIPNIYLTMSIPDRAHLLRPSRRSPSLKELEIFTRQLALMTRAGIPILGALAILRSQAKNLAFRGVILRVEEAISEGLSISRGMSSETKCFPRFYITLISAGERAGILDETLDTIADELQSRRILRSRMLRAAIYPAFVTATLTAIVTFLLVFVVPTFEELFNENGVALPWLTKQVINLSRCMTSTSTLSGALALTIGLSIILWRARGNPRLIRAINNTSSRIPIWASLTRAKIVSECSSLLASLTRVGIPILEALTITSETVQNETAKSDLELIRSEIIEGSSLSMAFKKSRHFTGLFANLIEAGENSGQLEKMLSKAAVLYREELEQTFELLKQLAEPALIIAIGVVVGTTVLAIYLPIFQIGDLSGATNLS